MIKNHEIRFGKNEDPPTGYLAKIIIRRYAPQLRAFADLCMDFHTAFQASGKSPWDMLEIVPVCTLKEGLTIKLQFTIGEKTATNSIQYLDNDIQMSIEELTRILAEVYTKLGLMPNVPVQPQWEGFINVFVRATKFDRTNPTNINLDEFIKQATQLYERRHEIGIALGGLGGDFHIHPEIVFGTYADDPVIHFRIYGDWVLNKNSDPIAMVGIVTIRIYEIQEKAIEPNDVLDRMIERIIGFIRSRIEDTQCQK